MRKFSFVVTAIILSVVASAADTTASAADLKGAASAAAHPLGTLLNGIGSIGDAANPSDLHSGGKGKARDGLIEPARDFSFSSQSDGGGSYAVTVNKKLLSF
tara:strand:- start:1635 stop:1940 length:306 start_codon:yes stop_codon:yes gene_type:complete